MTIEPSIPITESMFVERDRTDLKRASEAFVPLIIYPPTGSPSWSSIFSNAFRRHNVGAQAVLSLIERARFLEYSYDTERSEASKAPFDINTLVGTAFEPYMNDFAGLDVGQAARLRQQLISYIRADYEWQQTGIVPAFLASAAATLLDPALYGLMGLVGKIGMLGGRFVNSTKMQELGRRLLGGSAQSLEKGVSQSAFSRALRSGRLKSMSESAAITSAHIGLSGLEERRIFAARRGESLASEMIYGAMLGAALEIGGPLFATTLRNLFPKKSSVGIIKSELAYKRKVDDTIWPSSSAVKNTPPTPEGTMSREMRWSQAFMEEKVPATTEELENLYLRLSDDVIKNPQDTLKRKQANAAREELIDRDPAFQSFKLFRASGEMQEPDYWDVGPARFEGISGVLYNGWRKMLSRTGFGGPASNLMEASIPEARGMFLKMNDTILQTVAEQNGIARPVNAEVLKTTRSRAFHSARTKAMDVHYAEYRKKNPNQPLSVDEWNNVIGMYAPGTLEAIPNKEIRAAVKTQRVYIRMLTDMAQSRKILPEELKQIVNAENYFPIMYNVDRLRTDAAFRGRFINLIYEDFASKWPQKRAAELRTQYANNPGLLEKKLKELETFVKSPDFVTKMRVDAIDAAENATGMALGDANAQAFPVTSADRGWTHTRKLEIPQELLSEFADTHAHRVITKFADDVIADTTMVDIFGTTELKKAPLFEQMIEHYKIKAANATPKEALRFSKERELVVRELEYLWANSRGFYGTPATTAIDRFTNRIVSGIAEYANIAFLGRVSLSMIPEFFVKTVQVGVTPYLKGLLNFVSDPSLRNFTLKELEMFGIAQTQTNRSYSAHAFLEHLPTETTGQKFRALMKGAGKIQAKASLYEFADNHIRKLATSLSILEVRETLPKLATSSPQTKARFAALGIGEKEGARILRMIEKYGDGPHLNLDKWTDDLARVRLMNTINSSINNALLVGGISTTPTILRSGVLRLLSLFSNWVFAANHKIISAALQEGLDKSLIPIVALIGSGIVSVKAKEMVRGKTTDQGATGAQLIASGILYSGVTGVFGLMLEKMGNVFGGEIGETLTGRYLPETTENSLMQVLGPTGAFVDSGIAWTKAFFKYMGFTDEELSNKDFRRMYRIVPYQYHPVVYGLASGRWPGVGAGDERINRSRMRYKVKNSIPLINRLIAEELRQAGLSNQGI